MNKSLALILSPAFLFFIYDTLFYLLWIPSGDYSEITIQIVLLYFFVNLFLLILTFLYVNLMVDERSVRQVVNRKSIGSFVSLCLIVIGLYSLFMQIGGNLEFNLEEKYSEVSSGGIFYVVVTQVVAYILIYDIFVGELRPMYTLMVVLYVLCSAVAGGRSGVISLIVLVFYIFSTKTKINLMKIFLVGMLLMLFFVMVSVMRGTLNFSNDEISIGFLDFNQIFTLEETMKYTEKSGNQFGLFLDDLVDGFVPRVFNQDKKTSTAFTREVFPDVMSTTSYTSGFYANLLFVFGYFGLVVAPVILTAITFIYLRLIKRFGNSPGDFVLIFLLIFPLQIVRGGLFEFRVVFALFLVMFSIFAHQILQKKMYRFLNK